VVGAAVGAVPSPDGFWLLATYAPTTDPARRQRIGLLVNAATGEVQGSYEETSAARGHFRFGGDARAIVRPSGAVVPAPGLQPQPENALWSASGDAWLQHVPGGRKLRVGKASPVQIGALEFELPAGVESVAAFDARADILGVLLVAAAANGDHTILYWDEMARGYKLQRSLGAQRARGVSLSGDGTRGIVDADQPLLLELGDAQASALAVALPSEAIATAAAFAKDVPWAVVGLANGEVLRAGADGKTQKIGEHRGEVRFAAPGAKRGLALTGGADGAVRAWSMAEAKESVAFVAFQLPQREAATPASAPAPAPSYGWAVVDPEGRFNASDTAELAGLHYAVGLKAIELRQLRGKYRDTMLLAKRLGLNPNPLFVVDSLEWAKTPPEVRLTGDLNQGERRLRIDFTEQEPGAGTYVVRVNGREVKPPEKTPGSGTTEYVVDPSLIKPGRNVVEVRAYGSDSQVASRGVTSEFDLVPEKKPEIRLFALVAGVTTYSSTWLQLKWADEDARRFADALRRAALPMLDYDNSKIEIRLLTSRPKLNGTEEAADKGRIAAILEEFSEKTKERVGRVDIVAVFLAGHGMADGDDYFFLDKNTNSVAFPDEAARKRVALSAEELKTALHKLPLNQLVVLDTCNSSAFLNPAGPVNPADDSQNARERARDRLKEVVGSHVLMGAWNTPAAYESSRYGHGLLTYSLLKALRGYAKEDNGELNVIHVLNYAEHQVPVLAKTIGQVQTARYVPSTDYPLGLYDPKSWEGFPALPGRPALFFAEMIDSQRQDDLVQKFTEQLDRILRQEEAAADRYSYYHAQIPPDAYRLRGTYTVGVDGAVSGDIVLLHSDLTQPKIKKVTAPDAARFARALYEAVLEILPLPNVAAPPS
jgi:hypothetical protein